MYLPAEDLERFQNDIDRKDRQFDRLRSVWVVSNPQNYTHLAYIAGAFEAKKKQPSLFREMK